MSTYEWWRILLIVGLPALAIIAQFAIMVATIWWLKHNIPDLHERCDALNEKCSALGERIARLEGKKSAEMHAHRAPGAVSAAG